MCRTVGVACKYKLLLRNNLGYQTRYGLDVRCTSFILLLLSPKVQVEEKMSATFPIGIWMIMNISFWSAEAETTSTHMCDVKKVACHYICHQLWPCEINYGLVRSFLALPRSIMVLRDQLWPCEINYGLARLMMALQDWLWPCEIVYGLARLLMVLQDGPLPCEKVHYYARPLMALRDHLWLC